MTVKPGRKTTEFALTLLTLAGTVTASIAGSLPPKWAAVASGVETTVYALSRALVKSSAAKATAAPAA
jgi:hypothetical protein